MKKCILFYFALLLSLNSFSQELVRGPYLQSLAPTSIKIIWRTSIPSLGIINVATPKGEVVFTSSSSVEATDHIFLVTGLIPGNTYHYRIGANDLFFTEWNEKYRFTTIPPNTNSTSFWATGDFGAQSQSQIEVRDAFINYVSPNFPDFWIWLGDNAYDDGKDVEFQDAVFSQPYGYDSLLTFLPFYPVPGNHDYNSVNQFAPPPAHNGPYYKIVEVPKNGEAGGVPSGTELYYSYDYGNAHFVALNSELFAYTFFAQSVMEDWLRADLAASDKLWKIVYWHQPPYSKGSHNSDDAFEVFMKAMRKNYNPIIESYGVDLVLCGHSHVYERSHLIKGHFGNSGSFNENMFVDNELPYNKWLDGDQPNFGTMYAVVGNSGKKEGDAPGGHPIFAATDYGDDAYGSLMVNIDANVLSGTYLRGDGSIGDEFTITKGLQDSSVITGLADIFVSSFNVYPNPTKDELNIKFDVVKPLKMNFYLYDISGKQYYCEESVNYLVGNHLKQINLNTLNIPSGSYIVKLGGGDSKNIWKYEKIIKVE